MKVVIFGASSEIGRLTLTRVRAEGYSIKEIGRSKVDELSDFVEFSIENPSVSQIGDADFAIFFGWKHFPRTQETRIQNINAYSELRDWATINGVKPIFVSTLSSTGRRISTYAESKSACEDMFANIGHVIKAGLIIHENRPIGNISAISCRLAKLPFEVRIFPSQYVMHVKSEELIDSIVDILAGELDINLISLGEPLELSVALSQPCVRKRRRLYIPVAMVSTLLKIGSLLVPRLKDSIDSWNGIVAKRKN